MKVVDVTLRESVYTKYCISTKDALSYIIHISRFPGIDYIEIGYINNKPVNGKFLGVYDEQYIRQCRKVVGKKIGISTMLHMEQFHEKKWDKKVLSILDMVRLNIQNSTEGLSSAIGYFHQLNIIVSVNISYISKISLSQFREMLNNIAKGDCRPDILYIADSNGSLTESELCEYVESIKEVLGDIKIGIHAHNHMGLALANSLNIDSWDYIDASINGFGKGAGNTNLESFIILNSIKSHSILSDHSLYLMYLCMKFFNEHILKSVKCDHLKAYEQLLYALKNKSYSETVLYSHENVENRIAKILNVNHYQELTDAITYAVNSVPYYKNRKHLYVGNFNDIPIINKSIYQQNVPPINCELLAEKHSSCFIFSTSGTTKKPQYVIRDQVDIDNQTNDYSGLDICADDVVLNLFWPGLWGIFSTANFSLSKTGATIVPLGGKEFNSLKDEQLIEIIKNFKVNVLCGVPSTIISFARRISNKTDCTIRINKIFCMGEKMPDVAYTYLTTVFNNPIIKLKYGCMETAGIGYQCKDLSLNQYHIYNNRFVEIIDMKTNSVLPIGEVGRIVVTTLDKRLVPLIRYDTGDKGRLKKSLCSCGEDIILEVFGRHDEEFIIGSVHLKLVDVQTAIKMNSCNYRYSQVIIETYHGLDMLRILVAADEFNGDEIIKDILYFYPDLKLLMEEQRINSIIIQGGNEYMFRYTDASGKLLPIVDIRESIN